MTSAQKRALVEFLQGEMTIQIEEGGFTDPNGRTIVIKIGSEQICSCSINIKQRREYEG